MQSFEELLQVARLLYGFTEPWFIAGGWAIDLFLKNVTRVHSDLEIAVFRKDQITLRNYLSDWEFSKVVSGVLQPWDQGEWLELPVHEIHTQRKSSELSSLEILLNESFESEWRFRRNPKIRRPMSMIGLFSEIGVPFLAPEIVILYKAKNPRAKDEKDFDQVRGLLNQEQRVWLKQAIAACHPEHPWLAELYGS